MSLSAEWVLALGHGLFGVVLPAGYLLWQGRKGRLDQSTRFAVAAWKLVSWAVFLAGSSIYVITNYVLGKGFGGIVVLLIGGVPLGLLSLLGLWQAWVNWSLRNKP